MTDLQSCIIQDLYGTYRQEHGDHHLDSDPWMWLPRGKRQLLAEWIQEQITSECLDELANKERY